MLPPTAEDLPATKAEVLRLAEEERTKVTAIQCPVCFDAVYSRARHDMRYCNCGCIAIDGGFDYVKIAYGKKLEHLAIVAQCFSLLIPHTRAQIFDDWHSGRDKLGRIQLKKSKRKKRKSH
jgi:hypothetical protein